MGPAVMAAETLDDRIAAMTPHADVVRPEGPGPFPVVVQMHGCGGRKAFQDTWAQQARAAGWAAVVLDSYAHRAISRGVAYATVCTGLRLWGRERAGDLYAALEWLRRQAWADADRMAAAGWSHGGWTVLDALALQPGADAARATRLDGLPAEPLAGLVGAFLVYPWAGMGCLAARRGLRYDARPHALVGGRDAVAGSAGLRATLEAMPAPTPLRVHWLDDATHAFDEPEARDPRVRYNPARTAQAHALYRSYLAGAH
ncbi:MAG: dienelactone hydrolase family protein [Hyphomonadaceae bacterium]|nr:dienelactone hydrolase family protein [Hyphomonadaceae bacterium]